MNYIKVKWNHNHYDEPIILYSELDSRRMEVRKVEVFLDRKCGYASKNYRQGGTELGEAPIPPLSEIAEDSQFEPEIIPQEEFEEIWKKGYGRT